MNNDLQIIEDYLPMWAIGAEASLEETVRKGHISMLHLCRVAVYGTLVLPSRIEYLEKTVKEQSA